jgi:beta-glucosidase
MQDDVDNMVQVGFDAYRFSISWSRIFPSMCIQYTVSGELHDSYIGLCFTAVRCMVVSVFFWGKLNAGGIGRINKDGVDYYHRLIDYMLANRT